MINVEDVEIATLTETAAVDMPLEEPDVEPVAPLSAGGHTSLLKHFIWTALTSFGVLGINFLTGMLVVRLLGDVGRGQIALIGTWTQIGGWAASMGFYEAITYLRARDVDDPRRIFGSTLLVIAVFGTIGVAVAELLIPAGFKGQTAEVISLARLWMFTIYLAIAGSMFNGLITGNHEFGLLNSMRFIQQVIYLACLVLLYEIHHFTVIGVMTTATACELAMTSFLFIRLVTTVGIGMPSWKVVVDGVKYGIRVQGALFAALANGRLDMLLMGRVIVGTGPTGLYSIATNLSGNVVALLGSLGVVVFPAATRAGTNGMAIVMRSVRFVFWAGLLGSAVFFVVCPYLLHLVYHGRGDGAVPALRLLLPGVVALAAMRIVDSGLQSLNRPQQASYAQVAGLFVTVVGLWLTLRRYGIEGAAFTSTVSYITTFGVALWFLCEEPSFSWREAFSPRLFFDDLTTFVTKTLQRLQRSDRVWSTYLETITRHSREIGHICRRKYTDLRRAFSAPAPSLPKRAATLVRTADNLTTTMTPRVSIIIATKNRQEMLVTSVTAILKQEYPDFEVIVVDTTNQPCRGMPTDPRLTYLSLTDGAGNRNWQRNVGVARATGDIAVVCDDDIIPTTRWLYEMVEPYADPNVAGVGGRVIEGPDVPVHKSTGREVGFVSWWGQVEGEFRARTPGNVEVDHLKGCNLSFRTAVLREVGGYDERIDGWAMRDETDVCMRIRNAGHILLYSPTAVVEHFGMNLWSNQDIRLGPPKNAYSGAKTTTYFVFRDLGVKAGLTWTAYYLAFTGWQSLKGLARMTARVVLTPIGCVAGMIEATKPPLHLGLEMKTDSKPPASPAPPAPPARDTTTQPASVI